MEDLKKIPGVDTLLNNPQIKSLDSPIDFIKYVIRKELNFIKKKVLEGDSTPEFQEIVDRILSEVKRIKSKNLKKVINATGIIMHTNLGRAPFSKDILDEAFKTVEGYNNLEFDLNKASRGSRYDHASDLLKYLCGAEDVLVVNNNAAAVVMILRAFAKNKEVIVSRGELIEIGGSFRLPDIIATSDCKMVEVGTTNKTKLSDYENAINSNTAVLFKAHQSNYSIEGFTEEVNLNDLVKLGKKNSIPVVYDMGSGLLTNTLVELNDEPNINQTLKKGVDLVTFSGDKLLGGPQAGIIAGKREFIEKLKKEPLLRALRVDKLTLSLLEANCNLFLDKKKLLEKNLFYKTVNQKAEEIEKKAISLQKYLKKSKIVSEVVKSKGRFGGGAMPKKEIDSYSVKIELNKESTRKRSETAEKIYKTLLQQDLPVLGVLRGGNIFIDVLCIQETEIELTAKQISVAYKQIAK